jgi:porin
MNQHPDRNWAIQNSLKAVFLFLPLLAGAKVALADDPFALSGTKYLSGDWGGYRTKLEKAGVNLGINYTSEVAYNAKGGSNDLVRYTDQFAFTGDFDLDKLLGLNDAEFKIAITKRNGDDLSTDAKLGTLQQVQEVFGRGQTWRLTQFWYDQKYFSGLLDWKIGRLTMGEDFASFSCEFQNLTFCGSPPGNIVGDYWFNWPVSQWATRVKVNLPQDFYVQVGAFEVNPHFLDTTDAMLPIAPAGATGVMVPFEVAWTPTLFDAKLKSSYKLGIWYNSSDGFDVVDDVNGNSADLTGLPARKRTGRYGIYTNLEQQVLRYDPEDDTRGLSIFLNATFADRRTSTIDNQLVIGGISKGTFEARPDDEIGFAVGRTHVNGRIADDQRDHNDAGLEHVAVQNSEYAFELYYGLQATGWLMVRPNAQYIKDPGGTDHNKDAVVLGLKTSLDF